jgi:signal transduction histidine kinase
VTANKIFHGGKDICFAIARDITRQKQMETELHMTTERLQSLSKQLLVILENERRHIARELHDDIGQELTLLRNNLQNMHAVKDQMSENNIEENIVIVDRLLQRTHDLSFELRPAILDDLGLLPALRWYANRLAQSAKFNIRFIADPLDHAVPTEIETACFRVAQETLTNVVRHSNARLVTVDLKWEEERLKLAIRDNGIGFDVKSAQERTAWGESFGLLGMQERVILAGGTIEIESVPAKGTVVRVCFPLK